MCEEVGGIRFKVILVTVFYCVEPDAKAIQPMSRKFTAKQRRYLYLLAGGHCEKCGVDLTREFHGDHRQAFSKGGETALHNGQALCPQCNLKKGNK